MAARTVSSTLAGKWASGSGSSSCLTARCFSSTSRIANEANRNGAWRNRATSSAPSLGGKALQSQSRTPSAEPGQSSESYQKSAMDDLSSSIEQLSQKKGGANSTASSSSSSASVYNPRAPSSVRDRQAVSGRAFLNGHYYNPQTLTYSAITERPRWPARPILGPSKKDAMQQDLLHIHGLNPGKPTLHDDSYKNAPIIANFMSEMGKILPRAQTGLTRKSQRSIGKAIRRARAIGLLPVLSRGGSRYSGAGWK